MKIIYEIKSGKLAGTLCAPHKNKSGKYIVSKTRFKQDHVFVSTLKEVKHYLDKGYKVRVSSIEGLSSPSLVGKDSLEITL